jgi:hypothetical protein
MSARLAGARGRELMLALAVASRNVGLLLRPALVTPAPVAGPRAARLGRSRTSMLSVGVLALALGAVLAAFVAPQPARAVIVFAAMAIVPGAAVMLRVPPTDAATAVGLTVALGLAIDTLVSLFMVWTGWWYPVAGAAVVGAISVVSILPDCRGSLRSAWTVRRPGLGPLAILPVILALVLWITSLKSGLDLVHLRGIGLPTGLLPAWYAALAIALTGAVVAVCRPEPNGWLIAAFIAMAAVIMYATVPALMPVPPNPWVYKHIGVTNLIVQTGSVHPAIDVYNRWPGFFSLAAAYCRLAGLPDAISFAAWSDLVFAMLDAVLVAAVARALSGGMRVAAWAALLYLVCNFVVQDYFSPQALAFALSLAILVLVLRQLTVLSRLHRWIDRAAARLHPGEEDAIKPLRIGRGAALGLILLLETAVVTSHQLTPYIGLLSVGGLAVLGVVRPRWRGVAALATVTLGFLTFNLGYLLKHYSLFTGFDPVGNANVHIQAIGLPWATTHAGGVLSMLLSVLAVAATVRLVRCGHGRAALVLWALAAAPYGMLFGQSYYGETSLRIFLFSSPWRIVLLAWGLATIRGGRRQALAGLAVVGALTALWLPAVLGDAPIQVVPAGEVAASRAFYQRAPAGSLLMLTAPAFPSRSDAGYAKMANSSYDANLTMYPDFRGRHLGAPDLPRIITIMGWYSRSDFLVFFSTADRYATTSGLLPAGTLVALEQAVRVSPRFHLWFRAPDARIYHLVKKP